MAPSYDLYDNIVFTDLFHRLFPALRHGGNHQCPVRGFLCERPGRAGAHYDRCAGIGWRGLGELHPDPLRQRLSERQGILGGLAEHRLYRHCGGIGDLFPGAGLVLDAAAPWRVHEPASIWLWAFPKARYCCQYLLEVILVAAIAPCDLLRHQHRAISHQIGSSLLSQVTSETYETVDLTRGKRSGPRTHRGFGPCRDRGGCFRRGLRTGVGFRHGAVCGFYRTGGLSHYEDEAPKSILSQMS